MLDSISAKTDPRKMFVVVSGWLSVVLAVMMPVVSAVILAIVLVVTMPVVLAAVSGGLFLLRKRR